MEEDATAAGRLARTPDVRLQLREVRGRLRAAAPRRKRCSDYDAVSAANATQGVAEHETGVPKAFPAHVRAWKRAKRIFSIFLTFEQITTLIVPFPFFLPLFCQYGRVV